MTSPTRPLVLRALLLFLPLAVVASGLAGTIYLVAQHDLRSGADSPQLQMAEDAAHALDGGASAASVVGPSVVDADRSLAPFVVVFDRTGTAVAASGTVAGALPAPPRGVLEAASAGSPNRVTWQPQPGLRFATVTVAWSRGTVMAARSLSEVERLEDGTLWLVAAGWVATMLTLAVVCLGVVWAWGRRR
jgi:hypothetical protein